jgi:hypothetical protein
VEITGGVETHLLLYLIAKLESGLFIFLKNESSGLYLTSSESWMRQVLDLEEQIENHCMLPD